MANDGRTILPFLLGAALALAGPAVQAGLSVSVTFNDPGDAHSAYHAVVRSAMASAADAWGTYVETAAGRTLAIEVNFTDEATASAGSDKYVLDQAATAASGVTTYMVGAVSKLAFGGGGGAEGAADAVFNIGEDWLTNVIWWNPSPTSTAAPPPYKLDSQYVFMHEIGHVLGFSSARDASGAPPIFNGAPYQTTFDALIRREGDDLFFTGTAAAAAYGGQPVPLTFANFSHVGNAAGSGRPGADLVDDVMNGVVSQYVHYELSGVDVGVLADLGYTLTAAGRALVYGAPPTTAPEPASIVALALGVSGVAAHLVVFARRRAA